MIILYNITNIILDKIEDDTESKAVDAAADDDNEFENEKEEEAPPTPVKDEKTGLLTNEEVDQLAKALGNKWEELAEELRHITQKGCYEPLFLLKSSN